MWALSTSIESQQEQLSFVGGKPRLPVGTSIPRCKLCDSAQTFMFQVAFPKDGPWSDLTLAVFFCTQCVSENHLIPEMLNSPLQNAVVPTAFLRKFQTNFSFEVFPTERAMILSDYDERVAFHALKTSFGTQCGNFGNIGGTPTWILEDESPASCDSRVRMTYLMEIVPGFKFPLVDNAPPQMELDLAGNASAACGDYYQLFLGNAIYFFGTESGEPLVYVITQTK